MRIVRTRSIANVDAARLRDSLAQIHESAHLMVGRASDDVRQSLLDLRRKGVLVRDALVGRGLATGIEGCSVCSVTA